MHRNKRKEAAKIETKPVSEAVASLIDSTAAQVNRAWTEVAGIALRDAKLSPDEWALDVQGKCLVRRT